MTTLDEVRSSLLELRKELKVVRCELRLRRNRRLSAKAGFNVNEPRDAGGRWTRGGGAQIVNNAQTGISTIDNTTSDLLDTLANVVDFLPTGSGPLYGIAVHGMFGGLVRFGNFPGIGLGDVETTFGGDGSYGSAESVRTDVILRNEIGDPIAIYDVKTGGAALTSTRADRLRREVGAGNIPVIELHAQRGIRVKSRTRIVCRFSVPVYS